MHTEAINHEPAICCMQTGNQITGRPCLGSWASLRPRLAEREPADVRRARRRRRPTASRSRPSPRGSGRRGFLPGEHAGVSFRSSGDPILYINNPPGVPDSIRRAPLDGLNALNEINYQAVGDPETHTRIQQYEMAFRMQASVPELTDLSQGTRQHLRALRRRGEEARHASPTPCCMARRLVERGVRFVQIYHNNWDHHSNVGGRMPSQCKDVDQPLLRADPGPQSSAACSTTRSSSGAANSAARSTRRAA